MNIFRPLFLVLVLIFSFISCDEDEVENLREATFTVIFLNSGTQFCNEAQLTIKVLITYPNGNQETHTVNPFNEFEKTLPLVRDSESINLKVFFPSSEDPIAEANIPFIFNGVSDEALEPPGNELLIEYCHNLDNGIRWDTFYE
ncbi:hypothetical protein H7U19_00425 [Hyunsoonleella sp. SJ7]|uniref:Uncharacterized protein n=1 Tax=Hyunsoonleella aquatilis TaxID=2762758 RepID=A0A923KJN2_9FLAO|nr:hypothetical protein [Hyunsoonleella aquatilis]MBC3756848.1 hypothetical protein [Hyunsoonleella aquatilis]